MSLTILLDFSHLCHFSYTAIVVTISLFLIIEFFSLNTSLNNSVEVVCILLHFIQVDFTIE